MASGYYFDQHQRRSTNKKDEKFIINQIPSGSNLQDFYSRPVSNNNANNNDEATPKHERRNDDATDTDTDGNDNDHPTTRSTTFQDPPIGSLVKERKVPIKVEPKVFLANERTFLTWMHSAIWLMGASLTILTYSDDGDPAKILYGSMIMPVAISFIIYAVYQYIRRADMIHRKAPGPYEDTVGPIVLTVMLMFAIIGQFSVRMFYDY